jgi:hypothetical protein
LEYANAPATAPAVAGMPIDAVCGAGLDSAQEESAENGRAICPAVRRGGNALTVLVQELALGLMWEETR